MSRFVEEEFRAYIQALTAEHAKAANADVSEVDLAAVVEGAVRMMTGVVSY